MPGLDVTFLNNVTRAKFIKVIKNNLYNHSPLFARLTAKGRVQDMTGTSLLWSPILAKHKSVGLFTGYDVFANQPTNPTVSATLAEASYYAALAISGTEERKNTGNMEKLMDILKVQFDNAEATLKDLMQTDLYGDGTTVGGRQPLYGLNAAVDDANTYAGILRTTAANAQWKSNVYDTAYTLANLQDPTSTSYLPKIMRTAFVAATHDHSPDSIVSDPIVYNLYQDIVGVQNLRVDKALADAGFGGVEFQGVGMMFDKFCTANYLYMLALDDFSLFVYPGANFDMPETGWLRPPNQDAKITQILWSGQLRLDSPWHQAKFSSVGAS